MAEGTPAKVLCACTGNICRSPAMEKYLQRAWGNHAVVTSAGTYAMVGWEVPDLMLTAMSRVKLDAMEHEPAQLEVDDIRSYDLVIVASPEHRQWIGQRVGAYPANVFLATEAAELAAATQCPTTGPLEDRIRAAAPTWHKQRADQPPSRHEGILDPYGRGVDDHHTSMAQITAALEPIVAWTQ